MSDLTCCGSPSWGQDTTDLGEASGFDFLLGRCSGCGAYWLNVFCTASSTTGYEQVADDDAHAMLAAAQGSELKKYMKAWSSRHL